MVEEYSKEVLDTAYELAEEISEEVENLSTVSQVLENPELDEESDINRQYLALDIQVEQYDTFTDVQYTLEQVEVDEDDGLEVETTVLDEDAYPIDIETDPDSKPLRPDAEIIGDTIDDNLENAEIQVNGEIIREPPLVDYSHFADSDEEDVLTTRVKA